MKLKSKKKLWLVGTIALSLIASTSYGAYQWWAYGGDQKRTRVVQDEKTTPPLYYKWQLNTGWSISQPVIVPIGEKKYIFHQAGGNLYRVPLDLGFYSSQTLPSIGTDFVNKGGRVKRISTNYEARSHLAYDDNTKTLLIGTGDSNVVSVDPNTMTVKEVYPIGGRLVTTPHVLPNGVMAIGTSDAKIRVFRGSGAYTDYGLDSSDPSSQITGSFAQVDEDKILVPLNYQGKDKSSKVGLFKVDTSSATPRITKLWEVGTRNGVASNVVYDERQRAALFADQSGSVYAVNVDSGQIAWRNDDYRSPSVATTLVNNSPALVDGNTLVVPFRYRGGRGKGLVVALDAGNGARKWAITSSGEKYGSGNYAGEIANDPTILKTPTKTYVMFGTTQGILRVVNLENGQLEPISYDQQGNPLYSLEAAKVAGGGSAYQGRGLATELLAGEGHLLFGGNDADRPNATGTNGILYAYAAELQDLILQNPRLSPGPPQRENAEATFTVEAVNDSEKVQNTSIGWWYDGENFSYHAKIPITLAPHEKRDVQIPVKYGASSRTVYASINPERNAPINESNWNNNQTQVILGVNKPNLQAKDIRINPTRPQVGEDLNIDVLVRNDGPYGTLTSDLGWKVGNGPLQIRPSVSIDQNSNQWVSGLKWPAVASERGMVDIWAKINPSEDKPVGETTYLDNAVQKSFPIGSDLDFYVKSVTGAVIAQGQNVSTRVVVGRMHGGEEQTKTTSVRLYLSGGDRDNVELTEEDVTLAPGEEKSMFIDWNSADPNPPLSPGSYTLTAVINPDFNMAEKTYANNYMTAGVTLLGKTTPSMCGPFENRTWAVSGTYTYEYNCRWVTINGELERICSTGYGNYYEQLEAQIVGLSGTFVEKTADFFDPDPPLERSGSSQIQAGQGFSFEVETRYKEDRDRVGNIYKATATFPTVDGNLEEIELTPEYTGDPNFVRFILPTHWLNRMTGSDDTQILEGMYPSGDYISGGRAHYTSLKQPDGPYPFSIRVEAQGTNYLTACLEGEVQVSGSLWDNFYVRQVDPENPFPREWFPDGPTDMWKDHMDVFNQDLIDWYYYKGRWKDWPAKQQ